MDRILVFASGSSDGGGSGFEHLLLSDANVVGVICNHPNGGVKRIADKWDIPFILMEEDFSPEHYQQVVSGIDFDLIVLWGWMKLVKGITHLPILNTHPGPLPEFGGKGMYGIHVHQAVLDAGLEESAITIHWADPRYDHGKTIAVIPVPILQGDTAETLQQRAKETEWEHYPKVIKEVLQNLATLKASQ